MMALRDQYMTLVLSLLCVCLTTVQVLADTILAKSGSFRDLSQAVSRAKTGDIVQIPGGKFYFSNTLLIPGGISLQGAGEDQTQLIKKGTSKRAMLEIDCSKGSVFRLTAFTMSGLGDQTTSGKGIELKKSCQDFRIDHMTFTQYGRAAITVFGDTSRGVIDHNRFIDNYKDGLGYGIEVIGGSTWPALELGTRNAVFIEDNYFKGNRHAVASNNGSRYVFRHNQIVSCQVNAACIDAHGYESWTRGSRSYEIYRNTVSDPTKRWAAIGLRGGDGVVFDNDFQNTNYAIYVWNGHTGKGYGSNCQYPCKDQIRKLYVWNNTHHGKAAKITVKKGYEKLIQRNRDYFTKRMPGYSPYTYPHPLVRETQAAILPLPPQNLHVLPADQ